MSKALYSSNGWTAVYEVNDDGSVYANITDNNGRQYAIHQFFSSIEELSYWLESK